ncbi:MAG: phenylalanine--tRNA ligase subunit beta [bacterium]
MKISLNWLKEYIDLSGIPTQEIVDKLTTSGLEVEEVIDKGKIYDNFVIGYVTEKKKHPNADKLSLCKVSDGSHVYNVVCGAPNVEAGQKIVFGKLGAVVPDGGFQLKKTKIRGELSEGMICSEKELLLSENHEGIMVLDPSVKEGTPLAEAFGMNDVLLDINITPNRADAVSHIGIARDLAAAFMRKVKYPEVNLVESDQEASSFASVEIENTIGCPRYIAKIITDVIIGESPEWLKTRLKSIGSRPINNVVDVTNFVLHEYGQPLHAFDLEMLAGKKIVVKNAGEVKKFVTLDSKERELKPEDLMICDGEKEVAVAGVMGGQNSEVTPATKNILLEAAYFDPSSVRKTAKHLGLSTDASYRFERGIDPNNVLNAANRAADLIASLGNGKLASGEIDIYPVKINPKIIDVRFARINKVLGIEIKKEDTLRILQDLGFIILKKEDEKLIVEIPTFRHDLEREVDLIEEVARIYGYDNIPPIERIGITLDDKIDESKFNNDVRNTLAAMGFYEILTNSLLSDEVAAKFGGNIKVLNPQSVEMTHLRPSLVPGMLITIQKNLRVKENDLLLFEIGHQMIKKSESEIKSFDDFEETEHVLLMLTGRDTIKEWHSKERYFDFYDLKGYVESFIQKISLSKKVEFKIPEAADSLYEYKVEVNVNRKMIGSGGKVDEIILKYFDIDQDVYLFDFDTSVLKTLSEVKMGFKELLKYPKMVRDLAFVFDKEVKVHSIMELISSKSSNLLKNKKLFDIFESDSLGQGKKSLAFQLEYYDEARTLTDEEVDKEFWEVIEEVKNKFNAQLRGG